MVRFDTGDCDTVAPNDDPIPRSLKPARIQWAMAIVHWLVSCTKQRFKILQVINCLSEPMYWLGSVRTLIWWRNQIVAPLSEEWTFRACMLPLLLQCFTPTTAIFVCPLFFGVAHFHHVVERIKMGMGIKHALFISCKFNMSLKDI